jgi:hypothetical protein
MEYLDVAWHHSNKDYPVRLVSELDDRRFETRKLEFFADGKVRHASQRGGTPGTMLGAAPVPPIAEINADEQFVGNSITGAEFEALWRRHVAHDT